MLLTLGGFWLFPRSARLGLPVGFRWLWLDFAARLLHGSTDSEGVVRCLVRFRWLWLALLLAILRQYPLISQHLLALLASIFLIIFNRGLISPHGALTHPHVASLCVRKAASPSSISCASRRHPAKEPSRSIVPSVPRINFCTRASMTGANENLGTTEKRKGLYFA